MIFYNILTWRKGPLAHLVERFHGMEEATGSIPVRSTKNCFRQFFVTAASKLLCLRTGSERQKPRVMVKKNFRQEIYSGPQ